MENLKITQSTDEEYKASLCGLLDEISKLEDDEPREGTETHKKWEKHLLKLYKEFNEKGQMKVFKETKL